MMHQQINQFAEVRGLSQSSAARVLVDRGLAEQNEVLDMKLDKLNKLLQAVLHASIASRIFSTEAAQLLDTKITNDEFRERITSLYKRYTEFEG